MRNLISDLRIIDFIARSIKIYCDNFTAVFLPKNDKNESHSKHIDIKYLFIKDHAKKHEMDFQLTSTELMIVDSMTKRLSAK